VGRDSCRLADRWGLDPGLADMVVRLADWWESIETGIQIRGFKRMPPLYIFSGFRTEAHNASVGGVPGSFHTACPSLAVDLRVGNVAGLPDDEVMAILGGMWRRMGGRWGGTFADPSPKHFDIGGV